MLMNATISTRRRLKKFHDFPPPNTTMSNPSKSFPSAKLNSSLIRVSRCQRTNRLDTVEPHRLTGVSETGRRGGGARGRNESHAAVHP